MTLLSFAPVCFILLFSHFSCPFFREGLIYGLYFIFRVVFSLIPSHLFLPPVSPFLYIGSLSFLCQLLLYNTIAVYPMQTVFRFSRCGAGFGNKKSPHNNLNLTIPSGMALVRVCYVAIRKLKTCSGSFGSRAGTLNKYVILNCWNRLPQKSQCVNKKL